MLKDAYIFSGRNYGADSNYKVIEVCSFLPSQVKKYTLNPVNRFVPGIPFAIVIELHTKDFKVYAIDANEIETYKKKGYTHYGFERKDVLTIQ